MTGKDPEDMTASTPSSGGREARNEDVSMRRLRLAPEPPR